jgi:tetratricopeptide (TPR) repeat protein
VADRPKKQARPPATNSLYERYKDALRRGHVASLRGRFESAIGAYSEAAQIAPDRALPHAAIGGILVKMNRPAEAVQSYGRALKLAPRDEAALRGQADLLAAAGRRVEAAELLDRLADVLDGSNRLADASDAARRALELAESRERRRQVETYATRLKASAGDEAAAAALARVLRVLEPPIAPAPVVAAVSDVETSDEATSEPAEAPEPEPEPSIEPEAVVLAATAVHAVSEDEDQATEAAESVEATEEALEAEMVSELDAEGPSGAIEETAPADAEAAPPEAGPEPEPEPVLEPEPEPEPVDAFVVGRAAEEALARGDASAARDGLLAAAAAHREAGRSFAAIDACYLALAVAPADVDLHLMLTRLYLERGWRGPAVDKLLLLGRLADLAEDADTRVRLRDLASRELPDEPRLADLVA